MNELDGDVITLLLECRGVRCHHPSKLQEPPRSYAFCHIICTENSTMSKWKLLFQTDLSRQSGSVTTCPGTLNIPKLVHNVKNIKAQTQIPCLHSHAHTYTHIYPNLTQFRSYNQATTSMLCKNCFFNLCAD